MSRVQIIKDKYTELFGIAPKYVVAAPGRVNLIGEHTDYNDGFVLPMAIDYSVMIACAPNDTRTVEAYSLNFDSMCTFSLDAIEKDKKYSWCDYIKGVLVMLKEKGIAINGAKMVLDGNVPQGSGLSSSAALEVATAFAFQTMNSFEMNGPYMAKLCQDAENKFVGVNCGIMDQFISRLGKEDHALFIDCRTYEYKLVPIPNDGVKFVIVDSKKKRGLVDSEYNTRRSQCEEAVRVLKTYLPEIKALRDVSYNDFKEYSDKLSSFVRKRAEHVITENERVLKSIDALTNGDIKLFGKLMNESHDSLQHLYEVSCENLDIIVETARSIDGVYGSRMTGAGFGGCTVSLVAESAIDEFKQKVASVYEAKTGIKPGIYECTPQNGASVIG